MGNLFSYLDSSSPINDFFALGQWEGNDFVKTILSKYLDCKLVKEMANFLKSVMEGLQDFKFIVNNWFVLNINKNITGAV